MRKRIANFRTGRLADGAYFVVGRLNFILIDNVQRTLRLTKKDQAGFDPVGFVVKVFEFAGVSNRGTGLESKAKNLIKALVRDMGTWEPQNRPGTLEPRHSEWATGRAFGGWMLEG